MSWVEVKKAINSNFNKPLNEKLIEFAFSQIYVFKDSTTFTPERDGLYKIICIGAANTSSNGSSSGAAGGVAIKSMNLSSSQSYSISIGTDAIFNNLVFGNGATSAGSPQNNIGIGGTASGGDFNYTGGNGVYTYRPTSGVYLNGASVGVFIHGLSDRPAFQLTNSVMNYNQTLYGGYGILGFGFGEAYANQYYNGNYEARSPRGAAGIIIIPIDIN